MCEFDGRGAGFVVVGDMVDPRAHGITGSQFTSQRRATRLELRSDCFSAQLDANRHIEFRIIPLHVLRPVLLPEPRGGAR